MKGFEGDGNVPNVQLGDTLSGVNGIVFQNKMNHWLLNVLLANKGFAF